MVQKERQVYGEYYSEETKQLKSNAEKLVNRGESDTQTSNSKM